jgi:hypothetical protein
MTCRNSRIVGNWNGEKIQMHGMSLNLNLIKKEEKKLYLILTIFQNFVSKLKPIFKIMLVCVWTINGYFFCN